MDESREFESRDGSEKLTHGKGAHDRGYDYKDHVDVCGPGQGFPITDIRSISGLEDLEHHRRHMNSFGGLPNMPEQGGGFAPYPHHRNPHFTSVMQGGVHGDVFVQGLRYVLVRLFSNACMLDLTETPVHLPR